MVSVCGNANLASWQADGVGLPSEACRALRKPLEEQGFDVLSSTPEAFAERLKADHASMGEVIKAGNVKID